MASVELLDALSTGANTVATALGISHAEAARQLSGANASGLLGWEDDDRHYTDVDADRRFVGLSTTGLEELHRLKERPPGADRSG